MRVPCISSFAWGTVGSEKECETPPFGRVRDLGNEHRVLGFPIQSQDLLLHSRIGSGESWTTTKANNLHLPAAASSISWSFSKVGHQKEMNFFSSRSSNAVEQQGD